MRINGLVRAVPHPYNQCWRRRLHADNASRCFAQPTTRRTIERRCSSSRQCSATLRSLSLPPRQMRSLRLYAILHVYCVPALKVEPCLTTQLSSQNLAVYAEAVANASAAGAQIIVFPEDGLYGAFCCCGHL